MGGVDAKADFFRKCFQDRLAWGASILLSQEFVRLGHINDGQCMALRKSRIFDRR